MAFPGHTAYCLRSCWPLVRWRSLARKGSRRHTGRSRRCPSAARSADAVAGRSFAGAHSLAKGEGAPVTVHGVPRPHRILPAQLLAARSLALTRSQREQAAYGPFQALPFRRALCRRSCWPLFRWRSLARKGRGRSRDRSWRSPATPHTACAVAGRSFAGAHSLAKGAGGIRAVPGAALPPRALPTQLLAALSLALTRSQRERALP